MTGEILDSTILGLNAVEATYRLLWLAVYLALAVVIGVSGPRRALCRLLERHDTVAGCIVLAITVLLMTILPTDGLGDREVYTRHFAFLAAGDNEHRILGDYDYLVRPVITFAARVLPDVVYLLAIASTIYAGCYYLVARRLAPRHMSSLLYLFMIASTFFFIYGTRVLRQGPAEAMLYAAMMLDFRRYWWVIAGVIVVAAGFHQSVLLIIAAYLCSLICRRTGVYTAIWFLCLAAVLIFGRAIADALVSIYPYGRVSIYMSGNPYGGLGGPTGFMTNFFLYALLILLCGLFGRYVIGYREKYYTILLNTYIITSAAWLILIDSISTDRIAHLAWGIGAFIVFTPLLSRRAVVAFKMLAGPGCSKARAEAIRAAAVIGMMLLQQFITLYTLRYYIKF